MDQFLLSLFLALVILFTPLVGISLIYFFPNMAVHSKKILWICVGVLVLAISLLLIQRRPGSPVAQLEGKLVQKEALGVLDKVMDKADEEVLKADAELIRRQRVAEVDLRHFDTQAAEIQKITDSHERRKALIQLMKTYR